MSGYPSRYLRITKAKPPSLLSSKRERKGVFTLENRRSMLPRNDTKRHDTHSCSKPTHYLTISIIFSHKTWFWDLVHCSVRSHRFIQPSAESVAVEFWIPFWRKFPFHICFCKNQE